MPSHHICLLKNRLLKTLRNIPCFCTLDLLSVSASLSLIHSWLKFSFIFTFDLLVRLLIHYSPIRLSELFSISDSAFTNYMKELSPSTLDVEFRMLQIIDDDWEGSSQRQELTDIGLLLDYFIHQVSSRNNFEFVQAALKLFLKVINF